LKKLEFR